MKLADMKTTKVPIGKLITAPYNPRIMDDETFKMLKDNIEFFKCYEPLMVNSKTWHVTGGNQRLRALIELGYTEVEVVLVELSLEYEKQLNISLNKIAGRFDEPKLSEIFIELQKLPDFEIELTGFEPAELSQLLDRYNETKEDDFDFDATVESIEKPITAKGDIIELGNHRILCGDSSNPENLKLLLADQKVSLLNTDFPYNVDYYGGNRPHANGRPKQSRQWERIYSDNMPQSEYEAWMRKVLGGVKEHLKPGAAAYIWQGHRQIPPTYQILLELGFHISSIVCWLKESAAISYGDYSFRTEHALYGWLEGASHYFAGKPGECNVWEVKRDSTITYIHPTQKPVELAQRAIRNSSQRGDVVLDTFLGSGSTLIACESLDRRCFGLELDCKFIDALTRRYISYIGKDKVSKDIRKRYLTED